MSGADALKGLRTARVETRAARRRRVHVERWDDLRAEVDRIERASAPDGEGLRVTGNWSVGQILWHIARGIERSMDGFGSGPTMIAGAKARLLSHSHQPDGESIAGPGELDPPAQVWTSDGAARLRGAIERVRIGHPMDKPSPAAGVLSGAEWESFHLRHAALHLSFVVLGERS